jgi:hypothetical protein
MQLSFLSSLSSAGSTKLSFLIAKNFPLASTEGESYARQIEDAASKWDLPNDFLTKAFQR